MQNRQPVDESRRRANETTKDITVSQTMLHHAKPDTTAIYTRGNFGKAVDAQRVYMEQLLRLGLNSMTHWAGHQG